VRRALLVALLLFGLAQAAPRITLVALPKQLTSLGQAVRVDWAKGEVQADGRGLGTNALGEASARVFARAAAIADAQRLLAWTAERLRATNKEKLARCELTLVEDADVSALLRGSQVLPDSERYEWQPDGRLQASVTLTLPLYGATGVPAIVQPELTEECRDDARPAGGEK
jgi:hypothetical protein